MDTDRFIVHVKTDCSYKDIAEDVETRFDTSNFQLGRPLRAKTYSYLIDDGSEDKKAKTQKSVSKKKT